MISLCSSSHNSTNTIETIERKRGSSSSLQQGVAAAAKGRTVGHRGLQSLKDGKAVVGQNAAVGGCASGTKDLPGHPIGRPGGAATSNELNRVTLFENLPKVLVGQAESPGGEEGVLSLEPDALQMVGLQDPPDQTVGLVHHPTNEALAPDNLF